MMLNDHFPIAFARVTGLLDPETFSTLNGEHPAGVLAGFGKINHRAVAIFAQEPSKFAGAMGLAEARRICALMEQAYEKRVPVVGLLHSSGAKIQEGVDSLAGYAEIFKRNVQLSGVVPQISVVLGACAGGAVYSPALTDCVIMARQGGEMFITGPDVIRQTTGETTDRAGLGGADAHTTKSGVVHLAADTEAGARVLVRKLLSYMPRHCEENPPHLDSRDALDHECPDLELLAKEDKRKAYDVRQVARSICDRESVLELQESWAPNIVTVMARIGGFPVGVIANNPAHLAGALDVNASMKAARFLRFCDSFNLPIVTLVDVPGYWPGVEQEHGGIIRHGAKLLHAYAEAAVPCVTVILHKAYGGAYCVMGSKQCGATANFAWPSAEIAVMGPLGAVEILYRKDIAQSRDPEKFKAKKAEEYAQTFANPDLALKQGYIDRIIAPIDTRNAIRQALIQSLKEFTPHFKHRNIPL